VKQPLLPDLSALYASLLSNPAVSGLSLVVQWSTLNDTEGAVPDWTYLDEAFDQVSIWNGNNPSAPAKTIQLTVTPGFGTPAWALDQILPSCDALFQAPQGDPGGPCGQADFLDSEGMAKPALLPLPLPWNSTYQGLWQTFLKALATKYVGNSAFASIAVAGPTATSAEMILPTTVIPATFEAPFGGLNQTGMWSTLLASQYSDGANYSNPAYQNSDLAIIDAWNTATEMYENVFACTTLIVTSGDGLPNFPSPHPKYHIPTGFTADCLAKRDMDCAAETTIESDFVTSSASGNFMATQTSGLEASRPPVDMGMAGVELLTANTSYSPRILGGAGFNTSVANDPVKEGCFSPFPPKPPNLPMGCTSVPTCSSNPAYPNDPEWCIPVACIPADCITGPLDGATIFGEVPTTSLISPEQALYNVLQTYFKGTPESSAYGGTNGTAPLYFLQIYYADVCYAATAPPVSIKEGRHSVTTSAQDLLVMAAKSLSAMTGAPPPAATAPASCPSGF
jgi:hypothetical protein